MKSHGLGATAGCLLWALLLLTAVGGWRFARGEGWGYSRFGWSIADEDCRESMAHDYLATRNVCGMTLDQLRADLGDESDFHERWTYLVGDYVPMTDASWLGTIYHPRPRLDLAFTREGVLFDVHLAPDWLSDGPAAPFVADTWSSTPGSERTPMARDLVRSNLLLRARRAEVRQVLGDPDSFDILIEYRVSDAVSDVAYLEARLNPDGLILDACVTRQ